MKKLLITCLLAAVTAGSADARLSLADRMLLRRDAAAAAPQGPQRAAAALRHSGRTLAFITLAPGYSADDLTAEGVSVSSVRGDIALVSLPTADVERVADLPCVRTFEISRIRTATMDRARASAGVDRIHSGEQLDQPYTGAGVITAVVDGGLDPNHINFRDADGKSRIGYLGHVYVDASSQDGWTGDQYDADHVPMFTTDDATTFHGTHTLGILAGGYRGDLTASILRNTQAADIKTVANPYYGVAYEADLAAVCGDLYDRLIAEGIDRILDYAYYKKEPCVISLSLGSNTGVHSAQTTMSRFLDLAAKEAIIVVSAGNEGDIPLSLVKTFTETDTEAKTFIMPSYAQGIRAGQVYMYSDKPFTMQAVIFNRQRGRVTYRMPIIEGQQQGSAQYYCTPTYPAEKALAN